MYTNMSTNCDPAVASLRGWFSYLVRPLAILVNKAVCVESRPQIKYTDAGMETLQKLVGKMPTFAAVYCKGSLGLQMVWLVK